MQKQPTRDPHSSRRQADTGEPLLVLIIEPDDETAVSYALLLEKAGYDVATAFDAGDGWKLATERVPDIILTALQVPMLDAPRFVQRLRQDPLTGDIPVVVIGAAGDAYRVQQARDAGALVAPGEAAALIETVRQIAARVAPRTLLRRQLRRTLLALRKAERSDRRLQARLAARIDRLQVAVLNVPEAGPPTPAAPKRRGRRTRHIQR